MKHADSKLSGSIAGKFITFLLLTILVVSCDPLTKTDVEIPNVTSLLTLTPFVGDEIALREILPETERLEIGYDSIEGWVVPSDGALRFPVTFNRGAKFRMTTGATSNIPVEDIDITIKVEFIPIRNGNAGAAVTLIELGEERKNDIFNKWLPLVSELDSCNSTAGEIRFSLSGEHASSDDVKVLFGQPCIYHPNLKRNKNILLIGVDTLRADSCSPYGADSNITPWLSEFAQSGVLFENNHSQAPWTLPSFASMMTGRMPSAIAATGYNELLPVFSDTVGEILRDNGYATLTIATNPWIGKSNSGFEQGIDTLWYRNGARANVSTTRARNFINNTTEQDWFCFIHLNDPHTTYEPMQEYIDRFCDPAYEGPFKEEFTDIEAWEVEGYIPPDADIEQVRGLHHGEVAFVDKYVGELIGWMEDNDLLENTLVIFSSDHGEEFFEHGRFGHGHAQYDGHVKTPLVISGPGFHGGQEIEEPVGNSDILPTILEYAGIDIPDNLIGIPLQEIIGGEQIDRMIFGEETGQVVKKYVIEWPLKAIIDFVTGKVEVYNIEDDPGEVNNIAGTLDETEIESFITSAVMNMYPEQDVFVIGFIGDPDEPPQRFTGTIEVTGGYNLLRTYAAQESDLIIQDENGLSFDITSTVDEQRKCKVIVIFPKSSAAELTLRLEINGESPGDRFLPYGTVETEPSGEATVVVEGFPWPAKLPEDWLTRESCCYVLAYDGISEELSGEISGEMDPVEREKLRALGYLN